FSQSVCTNSAGYSSNVKREGHPMVCWRLTFDKLRDFKLCGSVLWGGKAQGQPPNSLLIVSAARRSKAATVDVGFAVKLVGTTLLPRINKFGWSCARQCLSTTAFFGSLPIMVVPMMWPEPP